MTRTIFSLLVLISSISGLSITITLLIISSKVLNLSFLLWCQDIQCIILRHSLHMKISSSCRNMSVRRAEYSPVDYIDTAVFSHLLPLEIHCVKWVASLKTNVKMFFWDKVVMGNKRFGEKKLCLKSAKDTTNAKRSFWCNWYFSIKVECFWSRV